MILIKKAFTWYYLRLEFIVIINAINSIFARIGNVYFRIFVINLENRLLNFRQINYRWHNDFTWINKVKLQPRCCEDSIFYDLCSRVSSRVFISNQTRRSQTSGIQTFLQMPRSTAMSRERKMLLYTTA